MLRSIVLPAVILLAAFPLYAANAPATAPATAPAFVGDWSTPKAALVTYWKAYAAQDSQGLVKSIAWDDPGDGKTVAAGMEIDKTREALLSENVNLLKQQYPADQWLQNAIAQLRAGLDQRDKTNLEVVRAIETKSTNADVKIDGEKATLQLQGGEQVFKFKKIDKQWRLLPESADASIFTADPDERKQMAAELVAEGKAVVAMRKGYRIFAADLKAGKYATAKDALNALMQVDANASAEAATQVGVSGAEGDTTEAAPPK